MSGGFEAAGDALTGGVIARAVEPHHGDDAVGQDGHTHEHHCLNCGAALTGPYCATCGQAAHLHRSLMALWHDIAHGVFHFEGKVWRTLPLLAWRPGDLTRRYIHGERARFVSPLALFLFCVFLTFATLESVGVPIIPTKDGVEINITDLKADLVKAEARVGRLTLERQAAAAQGTPTAAIDAALEDARNDVNGVKAASMLLKGDVSEDFLADSIKIDAGADRLLGEKAKATLKNPKLLLYKLQSSAYKFAWALIPLSLPFMWLMFAWRRQYKLYDHAIFVTYSLSFVMVLLIAMSLLAALGAPTTWALLLIPVHMFRQLKQAYQLRWFSALWRTFALLLFASAVLTIFALSLLALGLLG